MRHEIALGGSPGRSQRSVRASPALDEDGPWVHGPSDRQSLAAFCPAVLERQPARARAHPRTEPVGPSALAFLWLVGAFHGSKPRQDQGQYTQRLTGTRVFLALCVSPGIWPSSRPNSLLYLAPPGGLCAGRSNRTSNLPKRSRLTLPDNLEPVAAWDAIRAELRRKLGESTYQLWIAPIEVKAYEGTVLLLTAPPPTRAWVAKRFGRILESCAKAVVGFEMEVAIDATAGSEQGAAPVENPVGSLNPRYSFNQFIIGDGNRLAHAAALAVAELPGQAYNPLFLHAPPGLG